MIKLIFSCEFWISSVRVTLDDSDAIRDLKWRIKCPRNFRPSPWILLTHFFSFVANIIKINKTDSYQANEAKPGNKSEFDYSL